MIRVTADPVVVDLFCAGEQLPLNRYEKRAVVAQLTAEGRSERWISERLGISRRSARRLRRQNREGVYA